MSKKVIFISDFFIDEIRGGAEFCNDALINSLKHKFTFERHKSETITLQFINDNRDCFFIVANFFLLREDCKTALRNATYVIFEHDHKYIKTRDPSRYKNYLAPPQDIVNREIFTNAKNIFAQSKIQAECVQKNLRVNNVVNLGMSLWTDEQLQIIENNIKNKKQPDASVVASRNPTKNTDAAIRYCNDKLIPYTLIGSEDYTEFIKQLSEHEFHVFIPRVLESFNRVLIEARMLNCKV